MPIDEVQVQAHSRPCPEQLMTEGVRRVRAVDIRPGEYKLGVWREELLGVFGYPAGWQFVDVLGRSLSIVDLEVRFNLPYGFTVTLPVDLDAYVIPIPATALQGANVTIAEQEGEIKRLRDRIEKLDFNIRDAQRVNEVKTETIKDLRGQRDAAFTDRNKARARLNEYLHVITEDGSRREDARKIFRDIMEEVGGGYVAPMSARQQNRQIRALTAALGHMSRPVIPADVAEYLKWRAEKIEPGDEAYGLALKYLTPETPPEPEEPKWRKGDIVRSTRDDLKGVPLGTLFFLEQELMHNRADWLQLTNVVDPHRAYRLTKFVEQLEPELLVRDGLPVVES